MGLCLYISKNENQKGINLDKSSIVFIGFENLDILYCQKDMNQLPNSAGLLVGIIKNNIKILDVFHN